MNDMKNEGLVTPLNIAEHLKHTARAFPFQKAVIFPERRDKAGRVAYTHVTFQQLDQESDRLAAAFGKIGIARGTRTILMARPGIDFFTTTFALFKSGAVPVMVDPGMGIRRMIRCLEESRPTAFIGVPVAHIMRLIFPKYFKTIKQTVTIGRRLCWSGHTLSRLRRFPGPPCPLVPTHPDDAAAILFTTGSTGPAKGVVYTHGVFDAQIRHIRSLFSIAPGEIDLPTFPLFALFDPALAMTAVIPDMDPTRPGFVNPERILEAIENHGVTNMFASPALLHRVGAYGKARNIKLPTLKRVVSAGAPVMPATIEQFLTLLGDDVEIHTPYGATEAFPVSDIGSREILSETAALSSQGYGNCVGTPLSGVRMEIIKLTDAPIPEWTDALRVPDGEIGEIVVQCENATRDYFRQPGAQTLAKISDDTGFLHRMGDLGWRDKGGRIWFCGRKNHRVITAKSILFTIPCEAIFNGHPRVRRSALVGVGIPGRQLPVICIEPIAGQPPLDLNFFRKELLELATAHEHTKEIVTFLFHKRFPVDIRHNSKIFREQLAVWASGKLKKTIEEK